MCCIISIIGRSAHINIYLKLESFYQYDVYENSRVRCNVMREQSSEPMNPGSILIHRTTKPTLLSNFTFSALINFENPKIYLPFANPI